MLARYNRRMKKIPTDSLADNIQYQSGSAVMNQDVTTDIAEPETKADAGMEQEDFETYLLSVMKRKGDKA